MDQSSDSPDPPDRAVSPEPGPMRPNPFDDDNLSSRKRRRTSRSGSPSRSENGAASDHPMSSSPATDSAQNAGPPQDSNMKIDSMPSTPRTPDRTIPLDPAADPPSSRVTTINLRKQDHDTLYGHASSPPSPSPSAPPAILSGERAGSKNPSAKDSRLHDQDDTPASSAWGSSSPEIEVLADPDGRQVAADLEEDPEITFVGEENVSANPSDPVVNFPYHDASEALHVAVARLVQSFQSSNSDLQSDLDLLRLWVDNCARFFELLDDGRATNYILGELNFWLSLPDLFHQVAVRRIQYPRTSRFRQAADCVIQTYIELVANFVALDRHILERYISDPTITGSRLPQLVSIPHLHSLSCIIRPDKAYVTDDELSSTHREPYVSVRAFQAAPRGGLDSLLQLAEAQVALIPRYPQMINSTMTVSMAASALLTETILTIRAEGALQGNEVAEARARLAVGYQFFEVLAEALSSVIQKHVTHLSPDYVEGIITNLADVLSATLHGEHQQAVDRKTIHQREHPNLPDWLTVEAIVAEWRLDVLSRLIKVGHMQLRVKAVSYMCLELVHFFKANSADGRTALTQHLAAFMHRIKIVEYILGPTCHPEIAGESGNIVGFLVVTDQYRNAQTDLLWQTLTTAEDPRVCDALLRMTHTTFGLFTKNSLLYLHGKFESLPIASFNATFRALLEHWLKILTQKHQEEAEPASACLIKLCVRLLREASVQEYDGGNFAFPEVQHVALMRFRGLLNLGVDPSVRQELYADCAGDISSKSGTVQGSLCCLSAMIRTGLSTELHTLTTQHDLTRLLVAELEHAIDTANVSGRRAIFNGPAGIPRKMLLSNIVLHEPKTITMELGTRLLDAMVGSRAPHQEHRDVGWSTLNGIATQVGDPTHNSFLSTCFTNYLPRLPPQYIRPGTFQFLRSFLLRQVDQPNDVLDDGSTLAYKGLELLWRFILTSEDQNLADSMIQTFVDIHLESKSILSYPHQRARSVHRRLSNRCLTQMQATATHLLTQAEKDTREINDGMDVTADNACSPENQERLFTRSLAVLQAFLVAHRTKTQFAIPDLRSVICQPPSEVAGASADLKYQSFDGSRQTDVLALDIGLQNTAGSLLASLRQVTGFENYRVYYKGSILVPEEGDISKSLEDLHMQGGLLLVKKEPDGPVPPPKTRPGASELETDILGHFKELWGYLSMEAHLACKVHEFLTILPADSEILQIIDDSDTASQQIFPKGQPYKCLYAVFALAEYMDSSCRTVTGSVDPKPAANDADARLSKALSRTRSLVVAALSDSELVDIKSPGLLTIQLYSTFMGLYLKAITGGIGHGGTKLHISEILPLENMADILASAMDLERNEDSETLIKDAFAATLLISATDADFWTSFQEHPRASSLIEALLLKESSQTLRKGVAEIISNRLQLSHWLSVSARSFCEDFWRLLAPLVSQAVLLPRQCREFFEVTVAVARQLLESDSEHLRVQDLVSECFELLRSHETFEVCGTLVYANSGRRGNDQLTGFQEIGCHFEQDYLVDGLLKLIHDCFSRDEQLAKHWEIPSCVTVTPSETNVDFGLTKRRSLVNDLFWHLLFPRPREYMVDPVPRCILSAPSRKLLYEILLRLSQANEDIRYQLLDNLREVAPFDIGAGDGEPYLYELPFLFDRSQAVRATCGYSGLRNLGNTCYFNSLLTQLFMNTRFRRFMVEAPIQDVDTQELLWETRKVFASLQETNQRSVDPSLMVASIKTYDDTMIDIAQQMDVDEFYNLLFDRWESQLLSAEERKDFRSFYGGQLVQQVKSKECEHVSERLEPFSAVQLDIKGKRALHESLEAYVEGETMQGDNKYKCSSCDRHVDAVKRTCLKDTPDNLIFHLKRFDFDLRTLTRSKINDYFSFPTTIDMRPYSIEYLSNPSDSEEPDWYVLAGVTVHAGNAESGHYYSYSRERPSSNNHETWVEFNDELVSPWDPSNVEDATFGTPDTQVPDHNGVVYEKSHNAYMLFYTRASALEKEQEDLRVNGLRSPLKVDMGPELFDSVMNTNLSLLRRHCLYDHGHQLFVLHMFRQATACDQGQGSPDHQLRDIAMEVMVSHLDQVVSRARELPFFEQYHTVLGLAMRNSWECALAFFQYFDNRSEVLRLMVQRNPELRVRSDAGDLFIYALQRLREASPDLYGLTLQDTGELSIEKTIACRAVAILRTLWVSFHVNMRSWQEVFGLVLKFAQLGAFETAFLLYDDWLSDLMMVIAADPSVPDLPQHFHRMLVALMRRGVNRPPSYQSLIPLIDHLANALSSTWSDSVRHAEDRLDAFINEPSQPLPWSQTEKQVLRIESEHTGSIFTRKLLEIPHDRSGTNVILQRLSAGDKEMQGVVYGAVESTLMGLAETHAIIPYLRATLTFLINNRDDWQLSKDLFGSVVEACTRSDHTDSRAFFEFFRTARDYLARLPWTEQTSKLYLSAVPLWAPYLLLSYERSVSSDTERLLRQDILSPLERVTADDSVDMSDELVSVARTLGKTCLELLQRDYVATRRQVPKTSVQILRAVINHCERSYCVNVQSDLSYDDFCSIRDGVLEHIQPYVVDELEDEGSDWENSVASSEQWETLDDVSMQVVDETPR